MAEIKESRRRRHEPAGPVLLARRLMTARLLLAAFGRGEQRSLQRLIAGERETVELGAADALVTAIGATHELSDLTGSLRMRQNPRARARCCGGSVQQL
jgi:hypothetical protein